MKNRIFAGLISFLAFCLWPNASWAELKLGSEIPTFELQDIDGEKLTSASLAGTVVVFEWFNPGCPFDRRLYEDKAIQPVQKDFVSKGVKWISVASTREDHTDYRDSSGMKQSRVDWGIPVSHILLDPDGALGKQFGAKSTPHLFVFDKQGKLAYRGAYDNFPQTSGNASKLEHYTRDAISALLEGKTPAVTETRPYGCSIKYKK